MEILQAESDDAAHLLVAMDCVVLLMPQIT
jgi:hypothetical protein